MQLKLFSAIALLTLFAVPVKAAGNKDTLTEEEMPALEKGYQTSPLWYFNQLIYYSDNKDTNSASEALEKIDPYYLLWEWRNSPNPDSCLSAYRLRSEAKEKFVALYNDVLEARKSKPYLTFQAMANEDQRIRALLDKCADTTTCRVFLRRMETSDSIHFAYLRSYVGKYGWPAIKDGSMNATLLAIHDHANHNYYMPYLKKAVAQGQADIGALRLINHFLTNQQNISNAELLKQIQQKNYLRFDVTEVLSDATPRCLYRIQSALLHTCGKKMHCYYFFLAPDQQIFNDWFAIHVAKETPGMENLQKALQLYCPTAFQDTYVWGQHYLASNKVKLIMYIVYD